MFKSNKGYNDYEKSSKGGEFISYDSSYPSDPVFAQPLEVRVYGNNFEKALRAFRAVVQKERILSEYKEKQFYEKPSDKKRRKRNEMKRKLFELAMQKEHFKDKKDKEYKIVQVDSSDSDEE